MHKNFLVFIFLPFIVACGGNGAATEATDVTIEGNVVVVKNSPVLEQIVVRKSQLSDYTAKTEN